MSRRHIVRKVKSASHAYDFGTPERALQAGGLHLEPREVHENGQIHNRLGMRARAECALDALLLAGALGEADEASRRHKAGEWLRALHIATHPTRTAMSWEMRGRDQSEMSDRTAWNLKCLSETFKALGVYRAVVEAVCCDDRAVADVKTLHKGLDMLAELRGIG